MSHRTTTRVLRGALMVALLPLAACDSLLDVEAPGRIADEDLNTKQAVAGIVTGMKFDLSEAVDAMGEGVGIFTQDLFHGGSYAWDNVDEGVWPEEDVGTVWSSPQQARWVAEHGIERIREILDQDEFATSPLVAEAYLYSGFSNRILGEHFCSSTIDGGPEIPNEQHFDRALEDFTLALEHAQAAGRPALIDAAYAGRAQIKLNMGDYAGAAADAAQVPADFLFAAEMDTEFRNELVYETHSRFEYTVWGTLFEQHPDDARAPWEIVLEADGSVANGANGATPHFQQQKYTASGSDVPLAKGTEMLLIRAEHQLRQGNIGQAYALMNQARDFYDMEPLEPAASAEEAFDDLQYERRATLWLELRALWDLRRFFEEDRNDFLEDRDRCIPISETERESNPNLGGGTPG